MKKTFLFLTVLILIYAQAASAKINLRDTTSHHSDIRDYKDELGFFQKANRDAGDPRFMFADEGGIYEFGIGGKVTISEFIGFSGELNDFNLKFLSSNIAIPTDETNYFATKAACTLNFKARAKVGKRKLLAFLSLTGHSMKDISIGQAYISYGGLSFGMIPSFFMDLEVGPMTSGLGPDSPVDFTHTLLGYTHKFSDQWTAAFAMENAELDVDHYSTSFRIQSNFQPMPDLSAHVKYKGNKGHVQLGLLFRYLAYWSLDKETEYNYEGWNGHCAAYGISLSANLKPTHWLKLSTQFVFGRGIADYLPNIADSYLNVGISDKKHGQYNMLGTIPVCDGVVAAQINWSKKLSTSLLTGYTHRFNAEGVTAYNSFRTSHYFIGNVFYYIKDFAYAGVEFIHGDKTIDPDRLTGAKVDFTHGHASRLALSVAFLF